MTMRLHRYTTVTFIAASIALLSACGGGGGGNAAGDTNPGPAQPPPLALSEPDNFLLFPNPQVQADGKNQTDTDAYARAYYAAVDPANARDTLAKWRTVNGFDSNTGTQVTVVFGDKRDLGYGRRMTVRQNTDGTSAFLVANYLIRAGAAYAYSPLNLEAAILQDQKWLLGYNAIEFSPGPNGGVSFTKFYNFNATTGARELVVDLDGRGNKAMPGPCITCHGGRGDALTPDGKFNLVANTASRTRGDVRAQLHGFEVDAFDFANVQGFTRADQEAALKTINKIILCSYPLATGTTSTAPEDACRRQAINGEWQGGAADIIKAAYGGTGMPNAKFNDVFVPDSWLKAGQASLYKEVYAPACRTCHALRGTGLQSDIDLSTFEKFEAYQDRIKAHMVDRGNMPLAKIVYDAYYDGTRPGPDLIATFLQQRGFSARDGAGKALRPGRPLADPGLDRVVPLGASALNGSKSLYANAYAWSIVSGPAGGATITNGNAAQATFNATAPGSYVVQLAVSNGSTAGTPVQIRVTVVNALTPAPTAIRFADVKAVLQGTTGGCTGAGCHAQAAIGGNGAPVIFANVDRDGNGTVGDAADDQFLYAEVRSRINFTDVVSSPLLRKPAGNHHNGGQRPGFNAAGAPGDSSRTGYDLFVNWILNGAPQ
jgi:mono/diheme cytochrome c family protein